MAALSSIAAVAAITASAVQIGNTFFGDKGEGGVATPKVEKPTIEDPTSGNREKNAAISKRRRAGSAPDGTPAGKSSTLLSGASGLATPAPTERKSLLGL